MQKQIYYILINVCATFFTEQKKREAIAHGGLSTVRRVEINEGIQPDICIFPYIFDYRDEIYRIIFFNRLLNNDLKWKKPTFLLVWCAHVDDYISISGDLPYTHTHIHVHTHLNARLGTHGFNSGGFGSRTIFCLLNMYLQVSSFNLQ